MLSKRKPTPHLQVNYKSTASENSTAKVSYLSKGIGWDPLYKLKLNPSKNTAEFSLNARLHNSAEDLFAGNYYFLLI
jgi:hypothetical protein